MAAAKVDIFDMFQLAGVPGTIFVTWILFSLLRGNKTRLANLILEMHIQGCVCTCTC